MTTENDINKDDEKQAGNDQNMGEEDQPLVIAALAYLIFFIPLLTHPDNAFGRYHANQGLLLLITALVLNFAGMIIPLIGWFLILPVAFVLILVLFVMGIVNALKGRMQRLPVIGKYDLIK